LAKRKVGPNNNNSNSNSTLDHIYDHLDDKDDRLTHKSWGSNSSYSAPLLMNQSECMAEYGYEQSSFYNCGLRQSLGPNAFIPLPFETKTALPSSRMQHDAPPSSPSRKRNRQSDGSLSPVLRSRCRDTDGSSRGIESEGDDVDQRTVTFSASSNVSYPSGTTYISGSIVADDRMVIDSMSALDLVDSRRGRGCV